MNNQNNKTYGNWGEEQASKYIQSLGYEVIERNFRNRLGEIDIVAKDGATICFIEVKTRYSLSKGKPFESVTYVKQGKLIKLALSYLKYRFQTTQIKSRFDVISIIQDQQAHLQIKHIKNAFNR